MAGEEAARIKQSYEETAGDNRLPWMYWGSYLSERQWGTVREDYSDPSQGGDPWSYLSHDAARSRAYRWGEDGLAGLSDAKQRLCFALALWNEADPILKERLYGLTNGEGNHGEDVKEYYFYQDCTPTHSYMRWLYKYPQRPFPYDDLKNENARRKSQAPDAFEYELLDTGIFDEDRYFDVQVEYAKVGPTDILVKIRITNRGPDAAPIHVLPTLWFRNDWSWTKDAKPTLTGDLARATIHAVHADHTKRDGKTAEPMMLYCQNPDALLFAENETNAPRIFGAPKLTDFPKDGINDHIVSGSATVNPQLTGTKAAAHHRLQIAAGQTVEVRLRLSADTTLATPFDASFDATFAARMAEADDFYAALGPTTLSDEQKAIQRQAYAGMLWSKQFYYYVVADWLKGDPAFPPPPAARQAKGARNVDWDHVYASNVLSMPDAWEYPWFAAWDLCFQAVVLARVDLQFAKNQLTILAREWYMSPDGEVPGYEWGFGNVNPPLHAWAALRIYRLEQRLTGQGDGLFLAGIFKYCLMYFTWWTNRKDADGNKLFSGGFLGLDNIGLFDRNDLLNNAKLFQSDGTSWMGMFCLNMLEAAAELVAARKEDEYSRLAVKFFQHFIYIADAMNGTHGGVNLWDDNDKFYYDILKTNRGDHVPIKMRSLVGIFALFPALAIDLDVPAVASLLAPMVHRLTWFTENHPELLAEGLAQKGNKWLLSFVTQDRLEAILARVLHPDEFLSPHGVRGISRVYLNDPYNIQVDSDSIKGGTQAVQYQQAESPSDKQIMGGNSNWRGPVWFPVNFMLIEALMRFYAHFGDDFTVECPVGSGNKLTLLEVSRELARRMTAIFERDKNGNRPVYGGTDRFQNDPSWKDNVLFYEYFNGDNGAGLGASHQTGWTGLVAELLHGVEPRQGVASQ